MGKFRQCVTDLCVRDTIIAGYFSLTFLFLDCELSRFLSQ